MEYCLAPASSLRRVFRDQPFEETGNAPLDLAAAMNGWASGQVVIIAHGRRLKNVRLKVSELKSWEIGTKAGPDGHYEVVPGPSIPSEAFKLSRVHYVPIKSAVAGKTTTPGWYPDPLEPLDADSRFDVECHAVQPIWVSVRVPLEDGPRHRSLYHRFYKNFSGMAIATADVEGVGTVSQSLELKLRVFKFRLPKHRILRIWTMLDGSWNDFYNWMTPMEKFRALERAAFLLAGYGITPTAIHPPKDESTSPNLDYYESFYKRILELGVSHLQIARDSWPVIVKNGWEDISYYYFGSEWPREENSENALKIRKVMESIPLAKAAVAGPEPDDYLKGIVKVWIYRSDFPLDSLKERVKIGDEAQWYVCCGPEKPYANLQLDSEQIDPRVLGWQLFQYGLTGFYYWRATQIGHNDANTAGSNPEEKWPNRPWCPATSDVPYSPNDGLLIYPGPNGQPWSSIRLENLRDGADDYDYLCILRNYVEKLKKAELAPILVERAENALRVNPEVSACLTEYTKDPGVLERERRRICAYIEEARVALGEIWPA